MKKVLITSSSYLPNIGGIENSLYYLAKAGANDNVIIVTSDVININDDYASNKEKLNCQVIRYKVPKNKNRILKTLESWINAFKLYKQVRKKAYEIVISRYHLNTLLCFFAGLRNINYIVPGVVKYQSALEHSSSHSNKIVKKISYYFNQFIQNFAFKVSNKVFVFSETMAEQIHSIDKSCCVIKTSPGIDFERFNFVENENEKETVVNLLIVARLTGSKNVELAIESLLYLPDDYQLTIVGDGVLYEELKSLATKLNLQDRIIFEGAQSDVVKYYNKAHIFLLPSIYESFGQTLLEASSCGIPAVAFHSSVVKTATVDILGEYGIYANDLNPKSYSEAILKAYQTYYEDKKISRQDLRNYIITKYSWTNLYNKIVNESD